MSELNKDWCSLLDCTPDMIKACNNRCSLYRIIEQAAEMDRNRIMDGIRAALERWL